MTTDMHSKALGAFFHGDNEDKFEDEFKDKFAVAHSRFFGPFCVVL